MYKVRLTVLGSDGQRIRVRVSKDPFVIGRGEGCDYAVPDGRASRRHCALRISGVKIGVEDLNSRNGTFVNGAAVAPATQTRVFHDDELVVGTTRIRLSIRDPKTNQPLTPRQCGLPDPRTLVPSGPGKPKDASELDSLVSQLDALVSDLPPTKASPVEETTRDAKLQQQKEAGSSHSPPAPPNSGNSNSGKSEAEQTQTTPPTSVTEQGSESNQGIDPGDVPGDADATLDAAPATDERGPRQLPERSRKTTQNSQEAAEDALKNLFNRR